MRPTLLTLAAALALTASACLDAGSTATTATTPTSPTTPTPPTTPTTPTTPTPSPTPTPTTPTAKNAFCSSLVAAPDDALMIVSDQTSANLVRADGSTVDLVADGSGVEPRFVYVSYSSTHIATTRSWGDWDDADGGFSVRLHDRDGQLVWQHAWPQTAGNVEYVGVDGSVVLNRRPRNSYEGDRVVRQLDGTEAAMPQDLIPLAGAGEHGQVPARLGAATGWFDPTTASFVPVVELYTRRAIVNGDTLVVLSMPPYMINNAPLLTLSTPANTVTHTLTEAGDLHEVTFVSREPSNGWLLFSGYTAADRAGARYLRVHPDTLEVVRFDDTAPYAMWPMEDCYSPAGALDASGRLVRVFRNARIAQVFRRESDGAWRPLGKPFSDVVWVTPMLFGDTVLVTAYGQNETYCPPTEFDTDGLPEGTLVGGGVQLIAPDGAALELGSDPWDWGMPALRADGLCAALLERTDDGTVSFDVLDILSGERADLPLAGTPRFIPDAD